MNHPVFVKNERLFFQLLVFRRYFDTFLSLRKNDKAYLREFNNRNCYSVNYFAVYLITHLAFLFDKDSEYSLVNARFEVEELENKRLSILEEWNRHKDKILEITANTGILKYEDTETIKIAFRKLRRMDDYEGDKIIAFMESVAELHRMVDNFSAVELEKEVELEKQRKKRRSKSSDEGLDG